MDARRLADGIKCFNEGKFFDAHEALEDVWREMTGPEKGFMQGLVQVAVALHHHSTGNRDGARSVLARAAANLAGAPDEFLGIAMPPLRQSLEQWQRVLAGNAAPPPLPRFKLRERC